MWNYLIPNFVKEKIKNWVLWILDLELIPADKAEEIRKLLNGLTEEGEDNMNQVLDILKESLTQQKASSEKLAKENKELKEQLENERSKVAGLLLKIESLENEKGEIEKFVEEINQEIELLKTQQTQAMVIEKKSQKIKSDLTQVEIKAQELNEYVLQK